LVGKAAFDLLHLQQSLGCGRIYWYPTTRHALISRAHTGRNTWIAIVDTTMLVAFAALMSPGEVSGFKWHEWIGVAFIPLFVIHVVLSWNWIVGAWRRLRRDAESRTKLNFLLNGTLALMMLVVIASGLVVSAYAVPALGIQSAASRRWEQLHNFTSTLVLVVVGLHVGLNWSWVKNAWRRYVVSLFTGRETVKR
jgi:cytochrome b561